MDTTSHTNDYTGFFLIRDGIILQSITELYTGPYEVQVHRLTAVAHHMDTVSVSVVDSMLPINRQARRLMRYLQKVLEIRPPAEGRTHILIAGGRAKLFEQLLYRYAADLPHSFPVDHVELLFHRDAHRALALSERNQLSSTHMLGVFTGHTELNGWFIGLCEEMEKRNG